MVAGLKKIKLTIPSGSDTSNTANLSKGLLTGIRFPGTMTSTTFTINNSEKRTSGTFRPISDVSGGNPLSAITLSTTEDMYFNTSQTPTLNFIQVVTDSNEGADREIILFYKDAD